MADDHGVTHEQLHREIASMNSHVEGLRGDMSALASSVAVLVTKVDQADRERRSMRAELRGMKTSMDQRTGMERAVKWIIGVGSAIVSGGFVAWIAGLFNSGRPPG